MLAINCGTATSGDETQNPQETGKPGEEGGKDDLIVENGIDKGGDQKINESNSAVPDGAKTDSSADNEKSQLSWPEVCELVEKTCPDEMDLEKCSVSEKGKITWDNHSDEVRECFIKKASEGKKENCKKDLIKICKVETQ